MTVLKCSCSVATCAPPFYITTGNMMPTYATPAVAAPEGRVVKQEEKTVSQEKPCGLRNARVREMRAKETVKSLTQDLAKKNLSNSELELKLAPFEAYHYLCEDLKLNLPEPRTLQRTAVDL
ncbi:uncharacterized protein [Macrobrachium rosenbergii]|uniref:uncharacterized protein isoform X2 n=1 Tax=Macrobrachium rosenbergii TaxID=79674 RepID=UPI0034D6F6D2